MSLDSTEPLTEMSTKKFPGIEGRSANKTENRHLWANWTEIIAASTSHNSIGLHGLLQDSFTSIFTPPFHITFFHLLIPFALRCLPPSCHHVYCIFPFFITFILSLTFFPRRSYFATSLILTFSTYSLLFTPITYFINLAILWISPSHLKFQFVLLYLSQYCIDS
jgi:hypothetical protein